MRYILGLTLLPLLAAAAVPAADEKPNRAAAEFRELGGQATFEDRQVLVTVDMHRAPIGDSDLELLEGLSTLQTLDLSYTRVTDAGLKHLRGLKELKRLSLLGTKVTDAGLQEIAGLTALENLFLAETAVTDRGLEYLRKLTRLESLELDHTKVDGAGLASLADLSGLRRLVLNHTPIGDDGLKHLESLASFRTSTCSRRRSPRKEPNGFRRHCRQPGSAVDRRAGGKNRLDLQTDLFRPKWSRSHSREWVLSRSLHLNLYVPI